MREEYAVRKQIKNIHSTTTSDIDMGYAHVFVRVYDKLIIISLPYPDNILLV